MEIIPKLLYGTFKHTIQQRIKCILTIIPKPVGERQGSILVTDISVEVTKSYKKMLSHLVDQGMKYLDSTQQLN